MEKLLVEVREARSKLAFLRTDAKNLGGSYHVEASKHWSSSHQRKHVKLTSRLGSQSIKSVCMITRYTFDLSNDYDTIK